MDEDDHERAHELKEALWKEVHDLVDAKLAGEKPEVEELIRLQLTETFRFWKR